MELYDAIRNRRSVRKFKEGITIPREDYLKMIESAMFAPSAHNGRPWKFVVIEDREILKQIADKHPYAKMLYQASGAIVVLADTRSDEEKGFFQQDAAAAIENILLTITDLGYGGVWCGLYPRRERSAILQDILKMPEMPIGIIAVGMADEEPKCRGKFEPERIIFI